MGFKDNAVLYWRKDYEDGWVMGGMVLKCKNTRTFEDTYNELKTELESPLLIDWLIEEHCLVDDLFEGEDYKFHRTYHDYALVYVFKNSDGEEKELRLTEEHVYIP